MEKQTEHGALWIKTSTKGEYMTGSITLGNQTVKVVAFKNTNKKNPNEPDWRILESKPLSPTSTTETPQTSNSSVTERSTQAVDPSYNPEYPVEDLGTPHF